MSAPKLFSITSNKQSARPPAQKHSVLLIKPPFFSPWTPPLGIAILKTYLEKEGHTVKCYDFNTDPLLWGTHHKYFKVLQGLENVSIHDGYSKLWYIINAHMLAYMNGATAAACARVLETIIPFYGIRYDRKVSEPLIAIVEKYFTRLDELIEQTNYADFSVVGTSTYTTSLASSLFILKKIKKRRPAIMTVMGGGVFNDDLALGSDNLDTLIEEYPCVDHVVLGEGELLFLKLLQGELSGQRIISRAEISGQTLNIKDVPSPDFGDFDLSSYYHLTLEGGRSCPFQCSFCSETVQWGTYRKKPMVAFAEQLHELAEKYNNNYFFMGDSLMNPYIGELANALLNKEIKIFYDGYLRADKPIIHRDRVKLWARSGLYRTRMGIESASTRVLNAMDKMTTPQVIAEVLKSLSSAGVRPTTYWIVGFPGETRADFQETLDFIKANHRYIYELEAHPHYYYPYGQVGSRLYQSAALYPDEIIDLIRFKEWEVVDCSPTREEKFDRLREVSELAVGLGLPNIYSMADRYKAEERWHRLHPLAAEVYDGTRLSREEVRLEPRAIGLFAGEDQSGLKGNGPADAVYAYRASINKRLDEAKLTAAIRELVRSTEMLQVELSDGEFLPSPDFAKQCASGSLLQAWRGDGGERTETFYMQVVEQLSADMSASPGNSMRIALIEHETERSDIVLIAHRAIADSTSVILLLEDLLRIYEQLVHNREVSLRPVEKSYSALMKELRGQDALPPQVVGKSDLVAAEISHTDIWLEVGLPERMASTELSGFGLQPSEVVLGGVLRIILESVASNETAVDVSVDQRAIDQTLAYTVGNLTRTTHLALDMFDSAAFLTSVETVRDTLRQRALQGLQSRRSLDEDKVARVFVNFSYFAATPWLGGDEWQPEGFIMNESGLRSGYQMEILPVMLDDRIRVRLNYVDAPSTRTIAAGLTRQLASCVKTLLESCESHIRAKRYWLNEFGGELPPASIDVGECSPGSRSTARATAPIYIEAGLLDRAQERFETSQSLVLLTAYSILLSRLTGREDVLILADISEDQRAGAIPLRSFPLWNLTFAQFLQTVTRRVVLGYEHAAEAFKILAVDLPGATESSAPVFDVGFSFKASAEPQGPQVVDEQMSKYEEKFRQGLDLLLRVTKDDTGAQLEFDYSSERFPNETLEKLGSYLVAIVSAACDNPNIPLGDILLTDGESDPVTASEAQDDEEVFNFSAAF